MTRLLASPGDAPATTCCSSSALTVSRQRVGQHPTRPPAVQPPSVGGPGGLWHQDLPSWTSRSLSKGFMTNEGLYTRAGTCASLRRLVPGRRGIAPHVARTAPMSKSLRRHVSPHVSLLSTDTDTATSSSQARTPQRGTLAKSGGDESPELWASLNSVVVMNVRMLGTFVVREHTINPTEY